MEAFIIKHLQDSPEVKALINGAVFPIQAAHNEKFPLITVQRISSNPEYVGKLTQVRLQLNYFTTTYTKLKDLQKALHKSLHRLTGVLDSEKVKSCRVMNSRDVGVKGRGYGGQMDILVKGIE